jgi:thioredoxin-like negative regulator of GroEL
VRYHLATALNAAGKRDEAAQALEPILNDTAEFDDRSAAKTLLDQIKAGK